MADLQRGVSLGRQEVARELHAESQAPRAQAELTIEHARRLTGRKRREPSSAE